MNHAQSVRRILWVRTDAMGDSLLSASMLPHLQGAFPLASITVVCQEPMRALYEVCPHVSRVITFDRDKALADPDYCEEIAVTIRNEGADLALNSAFSREPIGDFWVSASGAPRRVGWEGSRGNPPGDADAGLDRGYTDRVPVDPALGLELERNARFLQALGIGAKDLQPAVWVPDEDAAFVDKLWRTLDLPEGRTVALFAGAASEGLAYGGYGEALRKVVADSGLRLVALGSQGERALNQRHLDAVARDSVNLCGQLTFRQTAALLRRCRLAVGAESGLAHLACAVGTPNVVVLGGGHFGRFMPYTPLTATAVLPLDCFLCEWSCPFKRSHCVKDLHPGVLEEAVRVSLAGAGDRTRLFAQTRWDQPGGGPHLLDLAKALNTAQAELISVDPGRLVQDPGKEPRTTVFCAVWHKDPKRFELLKGHQKCLDDQSVPVARVYVFDNGDTPPDWLKGNVVVTREPLGLYEAWNVALNLARTPYVMNLNLDDRLNPEAAAFYEKVLDSGADLVGGDWCICFSQEETDAVESCIASSRLPFRPEWPPKPGLRVRLGSGTGERGTYGPACGWRMDLHREVPRFPWQFGDRSPIRIIGDSVWWGILKSMGKVVKRLPVIVGRYHSHPGEQAEFTHSAEAETGKLHILGTAMI